MKFKIILLLICLTLLPLLAQESLSMEEKVLSLYKEGKYSEAISFLNFLEKDGLKSTDSFKAGVFKSQLITFKEAYSKIHEGIRLHNYKTILNNLSSAEAIDKSLLETSTFKEKAKVYKAKAYLYKAKDLLKDEDYIGADKSFTICKKSDSSLTKCNHWFENKHKFLKTLFSKSQAIKFYNPDKAKLYLSSIVALTDYNNDLHKKAKLALSN